jgi:putative ABC transport system substrate-binding protein
MGLPDLAMIHRRAFLGGLGLSVLSEPLAARAQQAGKIPRIGILWAYSPSVVSLFAEAFRQGLRGLGYVEGQNIVLQERWAEGRFDRLPSLENGVVASLGRPGGNVTGLSLMHPELSGKRLALLKEVIPKVSRVAVFWSSSTPSYPLLLPWHPIALKGAEAGARSLQVQLQILKVRDPEEVDSAFAAMARERAGAVLVLADPMTFFHRTRLADLAAKRRRPAIYGPRGHTDVGGLMSYWAHEADLYRRVASYVDRILKGAKPADLPVEQPTKFEFVINLKTAKTFSGSCQATFV